MVRQLRSAVQRSNSNLQFPASKAASTNNKSQSAKDKPAKKVVKQEEPKEEAKPKANTRKRRVQKEDVKPAKKSKTTKEVKPKAAKKSTVVLGQDPFPSHPHPTPEECKVVHDLLSRAHGPAKQPAAVPAGTLQFAGCGEVPSVLDALIRTLLSANTSAANSTRAFKGLVAAFGWDKKNGHANWENVRSASLKEVFKAIEKGGLANVKSKAIKKILDDVYEDGQKSGNGLSLDYLHGMNDADAMAKLTSFGGIGVKTATCVMMFCLRRAAFPVDTHVFRISKLLGWVPTQESKREAMETASKVKDEDDTQTKPQKMPPVTRDTTFLHLDATIPAELKYGLHQLMIRHGRYCPVCNASGGRKLGINQHGQPLVNVKKELTVKEENEDGTFDEKTIEVEVKEDPDDSDKENENEADEAAKNLGQDVIVKEEDGEGGKEKKYVPVDAAGGTGKKGGGGPDGGCILGDLIRWERLV